MKIRCTPVHSAERFFCLVFSHQGGNKKIGYWIQFYEGQNELLSQIKTIREMCPVFKSYCPARFRQHALSPFGVGGRVFSVPESTSDLPEWLLHRSVVLVANVVGGVMKHFLILLTTESWSRQQWHKGDILNFPLQTLLTSINSLQILCLPWLLMLL